MAECFVYVIGSVDGPKKIGTAHNVGARKGYIQCAAPFEVRVLAEWSFIDEQFAYAVEQASHSALREYHAYGEWFDAPLDEVVPAIDSAWGLVEDLSVVFDPGAVIGKERLWRHVFDKLTGMSKTGWLKRLRVAEARLAAAQPKQETEIAEPEA